MAISRTDVGANPGYQAWPRWVSLVLGVWLFISAFVWPHTMGEQTDTWILGVLIFFASIGAMYMPQVRFINTVLAIWLFFATLAIAHSNPGTLWNNCIVAIVVFAMSLIPSSAAALPSGGQRAIPAT